MADPADPASTAPAVTTPTTALTPTSAATALRNTPKAPSRGVLTPRPSTETTGEELDTIERAIDHPPTKADHFGTLVTLLGAAYAIIKTIHSPTGDASKDLALMLTAAALGGMQFLRYINAMVAKTPNKDAAKAYIARLREAQGWTPPPETHWQRLRRLVWARIFRFLEKR